MRHLELYRVYKPRGAAKQYRTFVVVSRKILIESRFSTVVCAPVLSAGQRLSTQVSVGSDEGLKCQSRIMCDNLVSIRKADLTHYVASLPPAKTTELNRALKMALDLP